MFVNPIDEKVTPYFAYDMTFRIPAIIDKDVWEAVQLEMERRRAFAERYNFFKIIEKMTVLDGQKIIINLLDGTEIECEIE